MTHRDLELTEGRFTALALLAVGLLSLAFFLGVRTGRLSAAARPAGADAPASSLEVRTTPARDPMATVGTSFLGPPRPNALPARPTP